MNRIKQKIISGGLLTVCAAGGMAGLSYLSQKAESSAVTAEAPYGNEPPVIILDAGHGGSSETESGKNTAERGCPAVFFVI